MEKENKKPKKLLFIFKQIRELNDIEKEFLQDLKDFINFKKDKCIISYLSQYVSSDRKIRPLILSKEIVIKIINKHGKIPNTDNFLLIGAVRDNGFFVLTHFETEVLQGNEL